jgi:peptidyl-prolyl cis-trans isomerase D
MSIIQDIRDKYAKVTVVLIALALLGFVLTDYFQSKNRGAGRNVSNSLGSVNGRSIDKEGFEAKVKQAEAQLKQQYAGYPAEMIAPQARQQAWEQEITSILYDDEINKLGIQVNKKEIGDIMYGPNSPYKSAPAFTDEKTGEFNPSLAKQQIEQMLKKGTLEQKAGVKADIANFVEYRLQEKYRSLFNRTVNVPKWFVEKQNADNSQMAKVSYVKETYASIPDSTISIENKDIADYISKHKDEYKQEESRSVSYVSFSAAPSVKDSTTVLNELSNLKINFDTTRDIERFLTGKGVNNYYNGYISGKEIKIARKDSIFRTPVGSVFGPYLDGGSYVLARLEGVRTMADTVKIRHILISTQQRDSATAKDLADSIKNAIAKGSNFDSLCIKFSDDNKQDQQTKQYNGGIYDNVTTGRMTPEFNDYIFSNPTGSKDVVKTEFGYHYIEILSQKGSGAAYKVAYLPKEITASSETLNNAVNDANQFFGEVKDQKSFDENYEKKLKAKGILKNVATNIIRSSDMVMSVGNSAEFVRSVYDARRGEVIKPVRIGDSYIVAAVTETFEEGTMPVGRARASAEAPLRNKKKAEILKKKIGTVSTLEAAATALGGKTVEAADSLRLDLRQASKLGYEPKVIGAAFNAANKGKVISEAIEGQSGVYVVRVDDVTTTPVTSGDVAAQRTMMAQQKSSTLGDPTSGLRKAATVKDKRGR